ncbi:MAG: IS110 family transposase [Lachnospiraceae bacterium]|nr:IS110 family transposase [Lachnospiraceae bacterium]MBQ8948001.1 IS110 family transposase [Lachnospiraceae bacterium]
MSKHQSPNLLNTSILARNETEVQIIDDGVEVQKLKSYGVGIDCHSRFIVICVHVRRNNKVFKYIKEFDTEWSSLVSAREWVINVIKKYSDPVPDTSKPLHYVIEATATYHMPILLAWEGNPSVINPTIAGATKRKTDVLDAERLSFHDLSNIWPESYIVPTPVQELRVLISEREHFVKLATRCSNRINNMIVRFGITSASKGSVVKNQETRALIEDLASDHPSKHEGVCPKGLPADVKQVIRREYEQYDIFTNYAAEYLDRIRAKVGSIEWETKDGTLPGSEMVRILLTTPGVGEITCFTWLAYVSTPRRFPNGKALSAYCGLDPSLKVSAGHVTSVKKRGGCRPLHNILVNSADKIMRGHSEAFGRWGYMYVQSGGKWKKATHAVARKLAIAMYYMMLTGQEFSYEKYSMVKDATVLDIPVEALPELNGDFKRYIKILQEHDLNTTGDVITSYLSCNLASINGLGRKFFTTLQDFITHQRKYREEYQKLHPESKDASLSVTVTA